MIQEGIIVKFPATGNFLEDHNVSFSFFKTLSSVQAQSTWFWNECAVAGGIPNTHYPCHDVEWGWSSTRRVYMDIQTQAQPLKWAHFWAHILSQAHIAHMCPHTLSSTHSTHTHAHTHAHTQAHSAAASVGI